MKAIIATTITALVLAGGAFATGSALDPRVPGLQRQIKTLRNNINVMQGQLNATANAVNNKLDKSCVQIVPMVIRPGYVIQLSDGSLAIYKAFDEYNASIDHSANRVMQLADGC